MATFQLNGIEIIEYIEDISWSDNDLDAPKSGRTLDTIMQRGKLGSKLKAEVKLVPISSSVAIPIIQALKNEYFTCTTDLIPDSSGAQSFTAYNSTRKGNVSVVTTDNKIMHKDISFSVIER